MNRVRFAAVLACGLCWITSASADDSPTRSRESFNTGWKFARFGPMADGSTTARAGGRAVEHDGVGINRRAGQRECRSACDRR